MFILGLSIRVTGPLTNGEPVFHDDAAALLTDGAVVSSIETKKLRKMKKNTNPLAAVRYVLKDYGIKLKAVDKIAVPAGKDYLNYKQDRGLNMNDYIRSWLRQGFDADIDSDISFIDPHLVYPTNIFNMSFYKQCLFLTIHRDAADFSVMISRGDRHRIEELDFFPGLEPGKFPLEAISDRLNFHQKNARHPALCITGNTPPAPPLLEKITSGGIFEDIYNHPIEQAAALALGAGLYLHSQETSARDQAKLTHETYRNETERLLTGIWQQVLSREKISINDNFFELGGNSLRAVIMTSWIHKVFNVKIPPTGVFKTTTIKELSKVLEELKKDRFASIEPLEEKEYYPVSSTQRRLYFLQRVDPGNKSYNIPNTLILEGEIGKGRVREMYCQMIRRHESFRTSFLMVDEEPVQRVHREIDFELEYHEAEEGSQQYKKILNSIDCQFDLDLVPLFKVGLIKVAPGRHILVNSIHHIIIDGVSHGIMVDEFIAIYKGEQLPPLSIQYKDYADWQNRKPQQEALKKQEAYWLKEFSGELPVLNLHTDYERPEIFSYKGDTFQFTIDIARTRSLNQLALKEGATLYIVLLAIYTVFLSKITGQEDIIVGTSVTCRQHENLLYVIGMFVNALAMRNYPESGKTFLQFLREVKERTLEAFDNQNYQFEDLVLAVIDNRDHSRNPIFDVMLVLNNEEMPPLEVPGLKLIQSQYEEFTAQMDLKLSGMETDGEIQFTLGYATKLFKRETIEMYINNFKEVISAVLEEPGLQLKDINISHGLLSMESSILEAEQGDFVF